jgi:hypothetical protein
MAAHIAVLCGPRRAGRAVRVTGAAICVHNGREHATTVETFGRANVPYVIITRDKPNSLALRNEVRPVHLDYLTANQHRLLAAGGQIEDDGSGGNGSVYIVDTDDRKEAEDFIANDPFTKAGVFADIKVSRWRKAFFNYERLV